MSRWPIVGRIARSALTPPPAPTLGQTPVPEGESSPGGTFFVVTTYVTVEGETLPSAEVSFTVDANSLLTIAPPPAAGDPADNPAIGWNAYIGAASGAEQLQHGVDTPNPMDQTFTLAAATVTGPAPPPATIVSENGVLLVEGTDYLVDDVHGHLTRMFVLDPYPARWKTLPITVQYTAGYNPVPPEVSGAVSRAVKAQYMARLRDPAIKSQSAAGIYSASYIQPQGASGGVLTPDVYGVLDGYRVPVIA